jgi:signal transduction histidine kinase
LLVPQANTIELVTSLAGHPEVRAEAAGHLAAHLGAADLLLFVQDPELGVPLPPLGFCQTLPGGRFWREFVQTCIGSGTAESDLSYPTSSDRRIARGWSSSGDTVLVLLDGDPQPERVSEVIRLLPLLSALFRQERLAFISSGHAQIARQNAAQAKELADSLDSLRSELQSALASQRQQIKERQRAETELARSNAALQQFAHMAAHDLQEPLRTVSSYAQLLSRRHRAELTGDGQIFITFITEGTRRMQELISGLLGYAQVTESPFTLEPVESEAILTSAEADLQAAFAEAGATLTRDTPLPVIKGDATQLVQLFENLLSNALKYRSDAKPRIHVRAQMQKDDVLFSVSDNGIGIDPKYHETIFGLFKRLHGKEYPGTGLGLASCQRIVERHGGRIWVDSQVGVGSTFRFTVPR